MSRTEKMSFPDVKRRWYLSALLPHTKKSQGVSVRRNVNCDCESTCPAFRTSRHALRVPINI